MARAYTNYFSFIQARTIPFCGAVHFNFSRDLCNDHHQDRFEPVCHADACTGLATSVTRTFHRAEMSPILMSSRGRFTGTGSPSSFSFSLSLSLRFLSFSIIFLRWMMVREGGESFAVLKRFLHTINRREIFKCTVLFSSFV